MTQNIKHIIITAALLLSITNLWAAGIIKISSTNGTVTSAVDGTTVTLKATPNDGYYITVDNFTVEKTVDGSQAGSITRTPGVSDLITVTASDPSADPSEATTYTFTLPEGYDAEVSADFQQRTNIADAVITLESTRITYTGKELNPAITSVVIGQELELSSDDYTVAYTDNINAGTATITLTGVRTCTGTASTAFSIAKANATIFFPQEEYVTYMDSVLTIPKLIIHPATLKVKYTSSNEEVATVNAETGAVTNKSIGETDITAYTDDDNCEPAQVSYKLTVEKEQGYKIYVNNTLVTKANKDNVFKDGDIDKQIAPTVVYNNENNTFVLTNAKDINIDCERTDTLRIYLMDKNYATSITSSENIPLIFTTNGAFPGNLKLKNPDGRIVSGFSDVKYEYNLQVLEGDLAADSALIGVELKPIVIKITQPTPVEELLSVEEKAKKEAADPEKSVTVKLIQNNFMYTYNTSNDNGPDPTDGTFILNTATTNEAVNELMKNYNISSNEFAENFNGISFLLSPGKYLIDVDADYYGDMELVMKVEGAEPHYLKQPIQDIEINTNKIIAVALYAVKRTSNALRRLGRKTKVSIAISSITVTPVKVNSCNAVSTVVPSYPTSTLKEPSQNPENDIEIEGTTIKPKEEDVPTGIENSVISNTIHDLQLYDLQGRRISTPQKAGIYISQGKKIFIK